MKLSAQTVELLKNFAKINPGLVFQPGKTQKTVSPAMDVFARAEFPDEFPKMFAIGDLNQFISTLGLFEDYDLSFGEKSVEIVDANRKSRKITYLYTNPEVIKTPPAKGNIKLPSQEVSFVLTEPEFSHIFKTASVLGSKHMSVVNDGEGTELLVNDLDNKSSNKFAVDVDVKAEKPFNLIFDLAKLNFLPAEYTVNIAAKQLISEFVVGAKSPYKGLVYNVGLQYQSTYDGQGA